MSDNNSNSSRKTLTLKINKPKAADDELLISGQKNNSVKITIKNKKNISQDDEKFIESEDVIKKLKVVSDSENYDYNKDLDVRKILVKNIKESKEEQEESKEQKIESSDEIQKVANLQDEKKDEEYKGNSDIAYKKEKLRSEDNLYVDDNFIDIRAKIKNSIEKDNENSKKKLPLNNDVILKNTKKSPSQQTSQQSEVQSNFTIKKIDETQIKKYEDEFSSRKFKNSYKVSKSSNKNIDYLISKEDEESGIRFKKRDRKNLKHNQEKKEYKKIVKEVILPDLISVSELANRMSEKTGDVVKKLFSMGVAVTANQIIDADTSEIIITEFGHNFKRVSSSDVENVEMEDEVFEAVSRAPVVTIMGHVDHGKTSLLDAIRSTNIVEGESGGITQHIGASRVKTPAGKYITFLDTPGHEAFTEMRSRGANVTDIIILVVAADDGVKEQTIEAISHAKAAGAPIIVAVNKIDKPNSDPSRVKNELLSYDIVSEELGGDVMFVEVSAKNKINLDKLEEAILLQAEILDLKSPTDGLSKGTVVESRIDPQKGVIATFLVQSGTLDVSDIIVVGTSFGRVRKMLDDQGKIIKKAYPSYPVEIFGLDQAPSAGEKFIEVQDEKKAREIVAYRVRKERDNKANKQSTKTLKEIFSDTANEKKYLNVIIKADVHGSAEALNGSLLKLNNDEVAIKVIHQATGAITESDVNLAAVSNAIILGFNVRSNNAAKDIAKSKDIEIRYYSIIYNVVDDVKMMLSGMLDPTKKEEYLGQAEIRQIFKISGSGKVAGATVIDGIIKRNAKIRLLRDNVVIYDGSLKALKRFKDDIKEVKSGFECGFSIDNFDDFKEKDVIECYEIVEHKREL